MDRESIIADNKKFKHKFYPETELLWIHPEEGDNFKLNNFISTVKDDIQSIDKNSKKLANDINTLLTTTDTRLKDIKQKLIFEKERLQDITILCNKYTDFENTINLSKTDFDGDFTFSDNAFSCKVNNIRELKYNVRSILGNGYKGNKYVYDIYENKYLNESLDTSKISAIKDSSISTYWEYSRLTANDSEKYICPEINFDAEEAKCTLDLELEAPGNEIGLYSEDDTIIVSEIYTSNDGVNYTNTGFEPKAINSKEDQYKDAEYVYSSGKLAIKPSKYIKIGLESRGHNGDDIAFERKVILENNDKDLVKTETHIIDSAKRHVIKINDLAIRKNVIVGESVMISRELISEPVSVISLFCNMYFPNNLPFDCVKFVMTVNGKDYDIVPVNSQINGKKIIRFSQGTMSSDYTVYTNEKIKSAKLKIIMKSMSEITPYINNVKILVGDKQ